MSAEGTQTIPNTATSSLLTKEEMTEAIIVARIEKNMTWQALADAVGAGVVWLTSACFGRNSMPKPLADKLCEVLELSDEINIALQSFPNKTWDWTIPQDPVLYRFYELIGVYGDTIKELIHEKFGDGIMSAIDFSMVMDKEENPAGDRVVITLNGKFLPYKTW